MVGVERIELSSVDYKSTALTFVLHAYLLYYINAPTTLPLSYWGISFLFNTLLVKRTFLFYLVYIFLLKLLFSTSFIEAEFCVLPILYSKINL